MKSQKSPFSTIIKSISSLDGMDSFSSPTTSDYDSDSADGDERAHLAQIEDGQSQHDVLDNTRETRDRSWNLWQKLDEGTYRPRRQSTRWHENPEHIVRKQRARKIDHGYTRDDFEVPCTPNSPRSLYGDLKTPTSEDLLCEDTWDSASVIGLLPSSPGRQPPSPSLDSEESRSLANIDSEDERYNFDEVEPLCALCRQINVEELAAGFPHYLLPDLIIPPNSCKLCFFLRLQLKYFAEYPTHRTSHIRVKLDLQKIQLWDEETGEEFYNA